MKHASLFSGIGGFDLAAEWMGWENIFHCEINQFCQKILKQHFPINKFGKDDMNVKVFNEMNYKSKPVVITLQDALKMFPQ